MSIAQPAKPPGLGLTDYKIKGKILEVKPNKKNKKINDVIVRFTEDFLAREGSKKPFKKGMVVVVSVKKLVLRKPAPAAGS